ncbi:hypothetical protein AB0P19_06885 [Microbacterium oleivorans]
MDLNTEVAVVRTIAEATKTQAEKTNGRVNSIEQWKNGIMAIDQYKKDNPTQTISAPNATTVVVQPQKWFQNEKLVGGVVAVLLALAAVLSIYGGMNQ